MRLGFFNKGIVQMTCWFLYRNLSASLRELRQGRFSFRRLLLSVKLGVNYGFLLQGVTVTVCKGACLSSMRVRVEIKIFARESRLRFSTLSKQLQYLY